MTTEIKREVKGPEDLAELRALLAPLIGKECWGARLGYGDELTLDIGGRVPRRPSSEKGEWVLRARATPFWLEPPADAPDEAKDVAALLRSVEGATIAGVDVHGPALALEVKFSNGYTLTLTPEDDADDADDDALSSWELFGPQHRILEVGPGAAWSHGRSDVP